MIDSILQTRRIIVTCGTGGVGKTTLSAAIALRAAMLGKKAVVVTIDPAKRLATSLGLGPLGDTPTDLTSHLREVCAKNSQFHEFTGSLHAVVPDTRRTFEAFVRELAPDPGVAERVMRNPIFQIFAREFSGTNEYMALERLFSLDRQGNFDCIILDTPPSRNTLAFLQAPKLLAQFFEAGFIRWLVLPANRIFASGMKRAMSVLERLTGNGFMTHLFDFASALFEVRVSFTSNLNKITHLLESPKVGFLMVTVPAPDTVPEALHFIDSVRDHGFHFDGLALNRTLSYLEDAGEPASEMNEEARQAFAVISAFQKREHHVNDEIMRNSIPICARLPELARDVHSIEDLFHVAMVLGS